MAFSGGNYTGAELSYVATRMAAQTGIGYNVCRVWVLSEQGVGFNPYGVTSDGRLVRYPNIDAGIRGAANLFNTAKWYANARANRGRSELAQAYAIALSPWGPKGGQYQGGGYYFQAWPRLGFPVPPQGSPPADWNRASAPASPPVGSPASPPLPGLPTLPPGQPALTNLATFLGKSPAALLTMADVDKVADAYVRAAAGTPDPFGTSAMVLRALVHGAMDSSVGKPIGSVSPDVVGAFLGGVGAIPNVQSQALGTAAGAAADVAGQAIAASLGAVIPFVVAAGVLLVAASLLIGGTKDVLS